MLIQMELIKNLEINKKNKIYKNYLSTCLTNFGTHFKLFGSFGIELIEFFCKHLIMSFKKHIYFI